MWWGVGEKTLLKFFQTFFWTCLPEACSSFWWPSPKRPFLSTGDGQDLSWLENPIVVVTNQSSLFSGDSFQTTSIDESHFHTGVAWTNVVFKITKAEILGSLRPHWYEKWDDSQSLIKSFRQTENDILILQNKYVLDGRKSRLRSEAWWYSIFINAGRENFTISLIWRAQKTSC